MMEDNKKILTMSFVTAGLLVFLSVGVILTALSGSFGIVARMMSSEVVAHGLPVGLGILTFVLLQFNPKVLTWSDEVVTEVRKVVWPSRKDTTAMTIVVCIMLLLSGVLLGLFDAASSFLVNYLVKF